MVFEQRMPHADLVELIKTKVEGMTLGPCSFCGGRDRRDINGVHWMPVDPDLVTKMGTVPGSALHRAIEVEAASPGTIKEPIHGRGQFLGPGASADAGVMSCAVVSCSKCGNVWLLSLHALGIFVTLRPEPAPVLRLIRGGKDVPDPEDRGGA